MPQFHELADAFPLITGEAFDELKADIEKHGQLEPVVMFEGKILDGRNRWRAMQELQMPHKEIKLAPDTDPVAYVWSKNAVRRQLSPAQKALAATKLVTAKHGGQSSDDEKVTTAQAARMAGVGERSVKRARRVLDEAAPEVVSAVQDGTLGLEPAELLAAKPKELQTEIMKSGPEGVKKAVQTETAKNRAKTDTPKGDGPGRGHVGPDVTMTRMMENSSAEGSKSRTKLWAENKELITKLDPELLKRFVTDLTTERRAIEQLLRLVKTETGTEATTPRATTGAKGADVPTTPVKVAAKKVAAPRKTAAPRVRKAPVKKTAAAAVAKETAPVADLLPKTPAVDAAPETGK